VKGTKLWQAAGSPIIQGQSRRQRPSWQQWLPAWAVVSACAVGLLYAYPALAGGAPWPLPSAIVGGLLGAVIGVEVARSMGWRFPLLWGAILGLVGAAALMALAVTVLPA
jgi:tetrahydromethanopterin S-methyltransferase subunit C